MKTYLLFTIMLFSGYIWGQQYPNYESFLEDGEEKVTSDYQRMVSKTKDGRYIERYFYPERKLLIEQTTWKTAKLEVLHGEAQWWYDNGHKRAAGSYKNGKAMGYWRYYSQKTGKLTAEGNFKDAERQGKWLDYSDDGILEYEVVWKEGTMHGAFKRYDEQGEVVNQGIYKDGEVIKQSNEEYEGILITTAPELDVTRTYTYPDEMPYFKALEEIEDYDERIKTSHKALLRWINEKIKYPEFARKMKIEGKVVIAFTVGLDGNLEDIEVIHGISESLEEEALRVLKTLPKWNPGRIDGTPVRVRHQLPIRFKLNN